MAQTASKKRNLAKRRTTLQLSEDTLSFIDYMVEAHCITQSVAVNLVFSHIAKGDFATLGTWLSDFKARRQF